MKLVLLVEAATLSELGWGAAVKTGGQVFVADCHHDAWFEYFDAATDLDDDDIINRIVSCNYPVDYEEGFISPEGTFLTREAALNRWRAERGMKKVKDRDWGDSEDLHSRV